MNEELNESPQESPAAPPEGQEPAPVKVGDQDMVPVAALTGERKRITEKYERELEPLRAAAARVQQLEAEITQLRTPPKPKEPDIPDVSDDEAERYARHYELYDDKGLDKARAKRIIKDQREEMKRVAREAADEAIGPVRQQTAVQASRENFVWAASQRDPDGQPLVDSNVLANTWAHFPPELAANREVAKIILQAAIGESVMTRAPRPRAPEREPVYSESPGGPRGTGYTISNLEKKVAASAGIKSTDWESRAKGYQPGVPNTLE